ncbi:hypothetical protein STEG23_003221 [Scotinomys teguina]
MFSSMPSIFFGLQERTLLPSERLQGPMLSMIVKSLQKESAEFPPANSTDSRPHPMTELRHYYPYLFCSLELVEHVKFLWDPGDSRHRGRCITLA